MRHTPLGSILLLGALLTSACADGEAAAVGGEGGGGDGASDAGAGAGAGGAEAELGPAYLFMHTVTTPDGRENYVYVTPSLEAGELDPKGGMEVSGASRSFALDGKVYVADGETFVIQRYVVDANLELVPDLKMSLANHGLTYFDTGWTFVNRSTAYYMNGEQQEVVIWDPEKMTISGTIDLSSLKDDAYPTFYADGGTKIGDYLYSVFWNYDEDGGPYDRSVSVAVIDTSKNELVNVARDERCEMGWPGTTLPNGDLYIVGNAAGTGYQFSDPPAKPNCLLRIRAGETEFDPDFVQYLDDVTQPLVGGSSFKYAAELNGGVVWATDPGDFADKEEFFSTSVWRPVLVDPKDWSAQVIEGISATGWMGETFVIDGAALFTVGTNGGSGTLGTNSALVRYDDGELTPVVGFSDWLQVAARIR